MALAGISSGSGITASSVIEAANAQRQSFYRIQDPVFICEQQFMATLIQIPRAINPELLRPP